MVYRHLREPQGRVTQIVDFLADPADTRAIGTLAGWVDREARVEDSDKIRCYATHAGFRRYLRRSGYFAVRRDGDRRHGLPGQFGRGCEARRGGQLNLERAGAG